MSIQMIGLDYEISNLDIRAVFSFNQEQCSDALDVLKEMPEVSGAVILSTCNRTELYLSSELELSKLPELFAGLKGVDADTYNKYLICRGEDDTVEHLFKLSCGMKSRVFGEDQIVTQVKNALAGARDAESTDFFLEKLFMSAITAAKKIKNTVHLTAVEDSVVIRTKNILRQEFGDDLHGIKCMVIGNGMIGRMASKMLVAEGADVLVTVRNYKTREVEIPNGCRIIDYKDRYDVIGQYDAVVSATTSPYCTVNLNDCRESFKEDKKRVFVDLAVPRDIDDNIKELDQAMLFDIDTLGGINAGADNEGIRQALEIIAEYQDKFYKEIRIKDYLGQIRGISRNGGELSYKRVEKQLAAAIAKGDEKQIEKLVRGGAEKTVAGIIFCLKDILPTKEWEHCVEVLNEKLQVY